MANILGLALKISADASGVPKSLTPVERALDSLGKQAEKATSVFAPFTAASEAAASAQEGFAARFQALAQQLQGDSLGAREYAAAFAELSAEAKATADAFAEGARITERNRTEEEKRAETLQRLDRLLELGAIGQREYNAEMMEATGVNAQIAAAERQRADDSARATAIIQANLTAQERAQARYDEEIAEYNRLRQSGLLSEQEFSKALQRSADSFAKATVAAGQYQGAVEDAGKEGTLKFNELSGILAALPGPFGNIAGRLSGLSSAAEGLGRVFSGGLSGGISSVVSSFAGLVNPVTAGLAAVAAFGAAATSITRGLLDLEDRVEKLGNVADKLGVSFGFIQTLEEAANRSGTSIDAVSAAFGRLQKSVLGVDEESKAAQAALASIGVTAEELQALSPEEQYRLIGESLQKIEDPAKRTAAATALFGKAGADLLPFFRNLGGAADDMARFGATLSDVDRQNIDSLGAAFDAVGVAVRGLGQNVLLPFAGLVEGLATSFSAVINVVSLVADAIGTVLAPVLDSVGAAFSLVGNGVNEAVGFFRSLAAAIEPIANLILPAVVANVVFLNREILVGAVAGLARSFTAAAAAAAAYATGTGVASISTAALGLAIRSAINSTGVGVLVTGFGLAAGALLEWAFSADEAAEKLDGAAKSAGSAADEAKRLADELAKEDQALADSAAKAIDAVRGKLSDAIDQSTEFGQAGFDAALKYQESIDELQRQFDAGILNEEAFKRAAEQADEAYKQQIDTIKESTAEVERKAKAEADAAQKQLADDAKLADSLLNQLDIDQRFGGDSARAKAAENVITIEREIARVQEEQRLANEAGDTAAANAAATRLAGLDQVLAREEDIASGIQKQADEEAERQKKRDEERAKALESVNKQIADDQAKLAEAAFEVELDRVNALSEAKSGTVKVGDLRSTEGASTFLNLASGAQDPAITEYRKQLKELQGLRQDIKKLETQKADILAGTG